MGGGPSPAAGDVRRLRYRLRRQGMLELDEWLAPLEPLLTDEASTTTAMINELLDLEVPDLLAMMHGERPVPAGLHHVLRERGRKDIA